MKAATKLVIFLFFVLAGTSAAIAVEEVGRRLVYMHCPLTGESVRKIPQKDAVHDQSERQWLSDAPFGIWSDVVDFELDTDSGRVAMTWRDQVIEARRLSPFRPSRIRAKSSQEGVTWDWRFRFQFLNRISNRFTDLTEVRVSASKKSMTDPRADVYFHGGSNCYIFPKCEVVGLAIDCVDKNLCLDRRRTCGVLR